MIAATRPTQRPPDARLLVVDAGRHIDHVPRAAFVEYLRPGDLVVAASRTARTARRARPSKFVWRDGLRFGPKT